VLNKLWDEAAQAFSASDHELAAKKLEELLRYVGNSTEGPIEQLRFNLGLAYFLDGKFPQAEKAFLDSIRQFPQGEYTSRAQLGVGRSRIEQDNKEGAIEALKVAAADPKLRSEAGLSLGTVYTDLKRDADAAAVFRSLMGSDIRTAQQTAAAVEMLGVMAKSGNLDELVAYLDRLIRQPGIRDAIAWYTNQVIVQGDELVGSSQYEAALLIYRSVLPRAQILAIQNASLESLNKEIQELEARVASEQSKPLGQRSNAAELLGGLKSTVEAAKTALEAVDKKADLDAALLMRRGRCLYFLNRYEEALVCFRAIRAKHPKSEDVGAAAYAEIVVLNQLKKPEEALSRGNDFLRKFPDSPNVEQVASLVIESLSQNNKWGDVIVLSKDLEEKFPKSESRDRWAFFQGRALFNDGQFPEAIRQFQKLMAAHPKSDFVEAALYHIAMANFLTNDYKGTLAACNEYLKRFPNGTYTGDILYRLAFVDFNDKDTDQSDRILKNLGDYLAKHPEDPAAGSMLVLIGDTWSQKKRGDTDESEKLADDMALDAYKKAVWSVSSDEVIQYALESATSLMQSRKDWAGISELHGEFLKRKPDSQLAMVSANWLAKMKAREGKAEDAAVMLADFLKPKIGNPASEQAELLIDQLVRLLVPPRRRGVEIDPEEIEKKVVDALTRVVGGEPNPTANARIYYARAEANEVLKRPEQAELYLKGIALNTDPANLSPILLRSSGEILLKQGDLDKAEAMFQRLADRYKDSMFSDAGPVGLGRVALARNKPDDALRILTEALEKNPGMSSVAEASIAQLQALSALERFDEAEKLALSIVSDKTFRGEKAGLAYLELAAVYRKRAAKQAGAQQHESLAKAHGYYQRVYLTYKSYPAICAEAMWQAYEVLKELKMEAEAAETIRRLAADPKLGSTPRANQAKEIVQ
jgi:TolA-binding protein